MSLLGQYKYIIDKSHSRANSEGAVYLHVVAAEEKLGRQLFSEEVVHHKDLNKLNNNPNNLMVFASNSDHSRFHKSGCNEDVLLSNSNGAYVCAERETKCVDCGATITRYGIRCKSCASKRGRKVERPSQKELFDTLVNSYGNFTNVGRKYGVTDNAVRKWCVAYGLPSKSHDYKI